MQRQLDMTWQLDMFPGGSGSPQFAEFIAQIGRDLQQLAAELDGLDQGDGPEAVGVGADGGNGAGDGGADGGTDGGNGAGDGGADGADERWERLLALVQRLMSAVKEADSFVACLCAQRQDDQQAQQLSGTVKTLAAEYLSACSRLDERLLALDDSRWERLLARDFARPVRFWLAERRRLAADKLPPELETLIHELSVSGYHGWGDHYNTIVSQIVIEDEGADGRARKLSAGQAANLLHAPDRARRSRMFALWEQTWGKQAPLCADTLNQLAGFRLSMYGRRGWDDPLKEPLAINRMSAETLQAMWSAVNANKAPLRRYLERKAQLVGVERPGWHDVDAPLGETEPVSYADAAAFIVRHFSGFSGELAQFAERVFSGRWIEAEDRPGKRPGGFCTSFPLSGQTRIFMTYAGTASNVSTLAHELGHAYHQHVMEDLPPLAQDYAMNVAETASTFAELLVSDAAVREAASDSARIALLDDKLQSAVAFCMNIQARFLFEQRFYEQRKQGHVTVEQLNGLMEQAQREAYGDALSQYHPLFWASKLHFYLTDVPFYNFPYTFGYLFSAGLYARAEQEGAAFASRYVALLRDTGRMTVEQLAERHLGADLRQPQFWQTALDRMLSDVELFIRLTDTK